MRYLIVFLSILMSHSYSYSQLTSWQTGFAMTYEKDWGEIANYGRNYAGVVKEASNGNLLFGGSSNLGPVFGELDWNGDTVWVKQIVISAYPVDVFETTDGYIWCCGVNNVFKTDKQGVFEWYRTYGTPDQYQLLNAGYAQDEDGNIWSCNTSWYVDAYTEGEGILVTKIDTSGEILMASELHTEFMQGSIEAGGLFLTEDGGAMIMGGGNTWKDNKTPGWSSGLLMKIDSAGKLEWQQAHFQGATWTAGYKKNDSTYAFVGHVPDPFKNNSPSRLGYMETDLNGNRRAFNAFSLGDELYRPWPQALHVYEDGSLRLTGEQGSKNYENKTIMVDLDSAGNAVQAWTHGGNNQEVIQSRNGKSWKASNDGLFMMINDLSYQAGMGFKTYQGQWGAFYYIAPEQESCFFHEVETDNEFIIPSGDSLKVFLMDTIGTYTLPQVDYWTKHPGDNWEWVDLCAIASDAVEIGENHHQNIYPNPISSGSAFRVQEELETFQLYNSTGTLILEIQELVNQVSIPHELAPGIYHWIGTNGAVHSSGQLVIVQ